jgi:hypothetical protein
VAQRQAGKRLLEKSTELGLLYGVDPGRADLVGQRRDVAERLARTQLVVAGIHSDPVEPGPDAKVGIAAGQLPVGLDEDVLRDVLGVLGAAEETQTEVVDCGRLRAVELAEGGLTAGAQAFAEPPVAEPCAAELRRGPHVCRADRHGEHAIGISTGWLHLPGVGP